MAESKPRGLCRDACPHGGNAEEQTPPCVDANTELAQSSRGDHRDLPAGIFVINGFWPRQPGYNNRGVVRDHLRGARGHKFRLRTRVNACEHECLPCPYSRLYSGSAQPAVSHLLALGFKRNLTQHICMYMALHVMNRLQTDPTYNDKFLSLK